jgi:membrane-associated PAP2 superfamily phosphatase
LALAGALCLGALFSFGQQARGAHFLSHDLASVAIAWMMALALSQRAGGEMFEEVKKAVEFGTVGGQTPS